MHPFAVRGTSGVWLTDGSTNDDKKTLKRNQK